MVNSFFFGKKTCTELLFFESTISISDFSAAELLASTRG